MFTPSLGKSNIWKLELIIFLIIHFSEILIINSFN